MDETACPGCGGYWGADDADAWDECPGCGYSAAQDGGDDGGYGDEYDHFALEDGDLYGVDGGHRDRRPPRSHEPEPAGPLTTAVGIAAGTVFVGSLVVVAVPMMVAVAATETVRRLWRSGPDGE